MTSTDHSVLPDDDFESTSHTPVSDDASAAVRDEAPRGEAAPAAAKAPTGPTFADLGLPDELLRAVLNLGFSQPTEIQAQAIPALLSGRDITGVAQTGTGKTAAFGLPLLAAMDPELRAPQALVLAPTRELALQVSEAIESFARQLPGVEVLAVYGGAPYLPQQRALKSGVQVVVGTPGRIIDHLERGTLKLDDVRFMVLDEADEMLRMGFAEDVDKILSAAPRERQVALFSATMPPAIRKTAQNHLNNPVEIATSRQSSTVTSVRQTYAVVPFRHKIGALARVIATSDADATIVFVRTRSAAEDVAIALVGKGITAAAISGDVAQRDREKLVDRLRTGGLDVLVATDVAARGLDVDRIGLVVNFDIPKEPESYVHRIGRTGRAGRTGVAMSFVTPAEQGKLRGIERTIRQTIEQVEIPSPAQVSAHRISGLLEKVPARLELGRLDIARTAVSSFLEDRGIDPLDAATVLAALAIGDTGPGPREREERALDADLASAQHEARQRGDRSSGLDRPSRGPRRERVGGANSGSSTLAGGKKYWVGVGHRDGVQPGAIVGALTNEGGLAGKDLGRIEIFSNFSLVEIGRDLPSETLHRIGGARVAGRPLRIRLDGGRVESGNRDGGDRPDRGGRFNDRPRTAGRFEDRGERSSDRSGGYQGSRGGAPSGDRDGGYRKPEREGGYRGGDRDGYRGDRDRAPSSDRYGSRDDRAPQRDRDERPATGQRSTTQRSASAGRPADGAARKPRHTKVARPFRSY